MPLLRGVSLRASGLKKRTVGMGRGGGRDVEANHERQATAGKQNSKLREWSEKKSVETQTQENFPRR